MKISKPKYIFLLPFILLNNLLYSQEDVKPFTKELIIISENDNYNMVIKDRYYTNGFFIRYNWADKKQAAMDSEKTLSRMELGQMIFNPFFNSYSLDEVLKTMDRPYAGWLYASYGKTKFYRNKAIFLYDGILGIVGPAALGKEIQSITHHLFKNDKLYGWEYQVKNEIGVNVSAQYYHSITNQKQSPHFTMHAMGKATLGNTFTNATVGLLLKAGRMEEEKNSAFWGGRLSNTAVKSKNKNEIFAFLEPGLLLQGYNATVQGGLFRTDKGLYTTTLNSINYIVKTGVFISGKRNSVSAIYTLKQRETKSMIDKNEFYGLFAISHRF